MSKNSAKNIALQIKARAEANKANTTNETPAPAPEGNAPENAPAATETPAPAAPLSPAALLRQQMAQLQAQLSALAAQESAAKQTQRNLFAEKLAEFLPSVNCTNLDEFAEAFREYRRGLETGSNSGGSRSKVSKEEKERILNILRRAKAPDSTPEERAAGTNLSVVAKSTGVSYQNLRNWAKEAGLHTVTPRSTV